MRMALGLALKGRGRVSPNPMVGAVVVKEGRVVGRGHHDYFGGPHAEVVALKEAGGEASGATLYVNLEPCNHHGKTPPCTEAIVRAGIGKVVAGMADPNPLVAGMGIEFLRSSGVEVAVGLLKERCGEINESFIKYITTGSPFVLLKMASTLDGKIAARSGQSRWITGEGARNLAHELRGEADAIMVGVGTILADDPILNYRGKRIKRRRDLIRIVVDSSLRTPPSARVVKQVEGAKTLIATTEAAPEDKARPLREAGAEVLRLPAKDGRVDLGPLVKELGRREIVSLLIEGGSEIAASAMKYGLVDKVVIFYSPKFLGGSSGFNLIGGEGAWRLDEAMVISHVRIKRLGEDFMMTGYINKM